MRILVASHTYIVDLNCEKLRALAQLSPDVEVTVVVPRRWRPGGVQNRIIEPPALEDGAFRRVPVANFSQNNQGALTFGAELIGWLRRVRPQIIHVEQGAKGLAYTQMITLNGLLGLGAKNVFFTWWNLPYDLKFPVSWLEAYNLHFTHGAIAGNQDGADILRQRGYGGPIRVMPQLGIDEGLFRPQPQPQLAQKLGIRPQEFVVGFVGRFVAEKGLFTLGEALASLRSHPRPWKWLLLGRGELKQPLMDQAEAAGICDRMIWVESVPHDEVPNYINLMDTLVLPSETTHGFKTMTSVGWKEQFGHVLIRGHGLPSADHWLRLRGNSPCDSIGGDGVCRGPGCGPGRLPAPADGAAPASRRPGPTRLRSRPESLHQSGLGPAAVGLLPGTAAVIGHRP
ncbi:Glycosyltransferase Group 1 family protein [Halomicronema hongdechloris C2206]|uniref:Glycosyltransferase Group 1 family protein n=1 Tax=Halomicronema hongdechloris C2206 TaxID=1641165 RepID=A0A1Z3HRA4_9CYAN|nr:glycosyltransferase [Halomicronema hongdechloris]ASC72841.1 Glycosyltransferase Group 1 family protein [Halomicronema hongdechloris C2206]